uniref:Uncharacterized protein n=1 Tax=Thermocrinis ruber TaxID=75906 RepID=A0A7C5X1S7_9AQUI
MNYLNSLYQQVLLSISVVLSDYEKQVKVGRPPKVSDLQIACLYVLSYITNTPVFNLYSWDYQRDVRFEEVHYGLLVMIVCDRNGIVYDMLVHPASYHEVRSVRIRYQKSLWFRALADSFCLMGDRGYRGLEYVHVCEDKPDKSVRQVIEAVNSQIKVFNGVSRWRNITTLLAYLQGYAVGYSFFRKSWLFE